MAKSPPQAFLVVGDPFLIEEKVKSLCAGMAAQIQGDLNRQTYYLADTELERVLTEARSLPFLAAGQIFQLRDLHKLKKADLETLQHYLEKPFPATFLILETQDLEKTDALVKLMETFGAVYFLSAKEDRSSARQFIRDKLKHAGKTMSAPATAMLEQAIGDMPSFLDSMLERLIIYAGTQAEITEAMVETFEEDWTEADIFKLVNAIADRRAEEACTTLHRLLENNENDIVGLLGMLHWQIRRLWVGAVLTEEGVPVGEMQKKANVFYKQAPFFMQQLRKFSRKQLEEALEGLFQLDWKMKSGRADGRIALETWVFQVTAPSPTSYSR